MAPFPLSGASVVSAAAVLLLVRDDCELVELVLLSSVVELSVALEVESVVVEASVVLLPLAVEEPEAVDAPEDAGREAVPSAPATVNAGAKLKLFGSSSSVMRRVYEPSAVTASAGMVNDALPAAAGTEAVQH